MYIQHSLSYAVRHFHLNWLTFLEAMTDVLGVHFLSGHSVVVPYQTAWQYYDGDTPMINRDVRPIYRFISEMIQDIHSYYKRRLENRTQAFKWYQLE